MGSETMWYLVGERRWITDNEREMRLAMLAACRTSQERAQDNLVMLQIQAGYAAARTPRVSGESEDKGRG